MSEHTTSTSGVPGPPPDLHADTHPSRRFQERLLANPSDEEAWNGLRTTYAEQAPTWRAWTASQHGYALPVQAGLKHAAPAPWAVEICCGTGEATTHIAAQMPHVLACDLNLPMLAYRANIPGVTWLAADVRALPLGTGTVPLLVALNGVLHPPEISRVIRPGGQLLWCTSFGPGTPLYVNPQRIHQLLGEEWTAMGGEAGHGEWSLFTKPSGGG